MTRFKRPRISIRSKLWLAISGTAIAVVGTIWLLQVVFLEEYYLQIKEKEFHTVVQSVAASIDKGGLYGASQELYNFAAENTLCIEVDTLTGSPIVKYEGLNYNCYIHKADENRVEFVNMAINGQTDLITTVIGAKNVKKHFISTALIEPSVTNPDGYIVIVSIALAPVREASNAIRSQLLLVSIIIIFASLVIAMWISHGFTKNILKVSRAAKQVAQGDLNVDVQVASNDEMYDLSQSFNEMTREIKKVNVLQRELVANISHDMRTPLTMIKGYAEAIKDITGEDKAVREHQLNIIVNEANRLSLLVNDAMDLSLMQAGQQRMNITEFEVKSRLADILKQYELLEQTSGFVFTLEGDEYAVEADELRIGQVVYNLINNAVNHIGDEKRITILVTADGESEVIVSITDTGTGIAKEDLSLIWDRYYKPYKKEGRKDMGTGLGLSIVKAILVNHGSRFGVKSTLGVGSTFWFSLKRVREE